MGAEPGQGCPMPNWSGYGSAISLGDRQNAVGRAATPKAAGSDRRWCLAGSIGCGPKWSSRSAFVEWTPDGLLRHAVYLGDHNGGVSCGVVVCDRGYSE